MPNGAPAKKFYSIFLEIFHKVILFSVQSSWKAPFTAALCTLGSRNTWISQELLRSVLCASGGLCHCAQSSIPFPDTVLVEGIIGRDNAVVSRSPQLRALTGAMQSCWNPMLFARCSASQTLWGVSKVAFLRQSPSLRGQLRMFSFFPRVPLVYISCAEGCEEVRTQQLPWGSGSTEGLCGGAGAPVGRASFGTPVFHGAGPAALSHTGACT